MNFCGNIDAAGLYACIPELFLTQIRAAGAGIGFGAGRCGAIIDPVVVPVMLALTATGPVFAIFAGGFVLAGLLVALLGTATSPLELLKDHPVAQA
jgi:hypothetical protein